VSRDPTQEKKLKVLSDEMLKVFVGREGTRQDYQLKCLKKYLAGGCPAETEMLPIIDGIHQVLLKNLVDVQPTFALWIIQPVGLLKFIDRILGKKCHASVQVFKEDTDGTRLGIQFGFQAGAGGNHGRGNARVEEFQIQAKSSRYELKLFHKQIDLPKMEKIFTRVRGDLETEYTYDKVWARDWRNTWNCTTWALDVARQAGISEFSVEKICGSSPWALANYTMGMSGQGTGWTTEVFNRRTPGGSADHSIRNRGSLVNSNFITPPRLPSREGRALRPTRVATPTLVRPSEVQSPTQTTATTTQAIRNPLSTGWVCVHCGAEYACRMEPLRCTTCHRFKNTIEGRTFQPR